MLTNRLERKDSSSSNLPASSSSSISIFFRGSKGDKDSSADEGNDNHIDDVEVSSPSGNPLRNVSSKHAPLPNSIYRKMLRMFLGYMNLRGIVILFLLLYTLNLLMYWLPENELDDVSQLT